MRRALAFLVLLAAAAACAPLQSQAPGTPSIVAVSPAACDGRVDASRPQYIVGYGSLMQDESRSRTSPRAGPAHPIELAGYPRGWFARGSSVHLVTLSNRQTIYYRHERLLLRPVPRQGAWSFFL